MEGDSTNWVGADELKEAGASEQYVQYYLKAKEIGISTPSTNHAEKVVNKGVEYSGGGFHDSIWKDEPRFPNSDNPYGADEKNLKILKKGAIRPITA